MNALRLQTVANRVPRSTKEGGTSACPPSADFPLVTRMETGLPRFRVRGVVKFLRSPVVLFYSPGRLERCAS